VIKRQHSKLKWTSFVDAVVDDDGAAAKEHLDAGRAIYYIENATPKGFLVKEHPNGRRELVRFNPEGDEVVGIL
jgi:hypothetical protein